MWAPITTYSNVMFAPTRYKRAYKIFCYMPGRGHSKRSFSLALHFSAAAADFVYLGCWIQIKLCGGVALLALTFCCRAVLALENSVLRLRWWLGGDWRDEKEWIKHAVRSGVLIYISWQAMKGLREYKVDAWGTNRYHLPLSFYVF